jgi:putative ABC transport system ATP-binding protein
MPAIIQFAQVSVTAKNKLILSDISFSLFSGEKAVICGKSGSGKSTVLRAMLGLHMLTRGAIYFQQTQLSPQSIQTIRSCTAYIGQEPMLGADNVRDALLLPFQFKTHLENRPSDQRLIEVLHQLQLPADILEQESGSISGGEKQRIALARGLLLGKTVYLLDEVTSALDAESKQAVFNVFSDPNLTVLSVAHDPEWLQRCGILIELEAGRLLEIRRHEDSRH